MRATGRSRTTRIHRSPSPAKRLLGSLALALGITASLTATAAVPAHAAAPKLPVGNVGKALENFFNSPDRVAGANDWSCKPGREHPTPVVLVHATFVNQGANWAVLSPMLANEGYCVYALNYGMAPISAGRIGGMGDIPTSAGVLRAFVDRVLARTGASKVDIVGHSQGGLLPGYYIKRLGGAAKVRTFVGLSPSNHGTTLLGLVELGRQLHLLGFVNEGFRALGTPSLVQQQAGSAFVRRMFADGDTVPGPRYVVIQTKNDLVVTPYTNAFLKGPNATNILIQDQCPKNHVGHIGMFNDGPVLQNVLNALGRNRPGFRAKCTGYGLPV
ncbi:esterase/lipase family protein [Spirillospora sp. CA-253888]